MTDERIYVALLKLDPATRGQIQPVLCALRDRIAEDEAAANGTPVNHEEV